MSNKVIASYWPIRGLGQPVRLMLEFVGEEWEDKHQTGFAELGKNGLDGARPTQLEGWNVERTKLGLDFPNLPYLIDGDVKLSQTMAILRYLGNKHGLEPKTLAEKTRADLAAEQFTDFRNGFIKLCYYDWENLQAPYNESLPEKLAVFDAFLGSRDWFAGGDQPSFVDFYAYEILDHHRMYQPQAFGPCKNLAGYFKRFEQLPKIKSYLASDRCIKYPVNAAYASWGGK